MVIVLARRTGMLLWFIFYCTTARLVGHYTELLTVGMYDLSEVVYLQYNDFGKQCRLVAPPLIA